MFGEGSKKFSRYLKTSPLSSDAEYWIWNPKQYLLAMLHFTPDFEYARVSLYSSHTSDLWLTYLYIRYFKSRELQLYSRNTNISRNIIKHNIRTSMNERIHFFI